MPREDQKVIVGQTAILPGVHKLLKRKTVASRILLKVFKSIGGIEDGVRARRGVRVGARHYYKVVGRASREKVGFVGFCGRYPRLKLFWNGQNG